MMPKARPPIPPREPEPAEPPGEAQGEHGRPSTPPPAAVHDVEACAAAVLEKLPKHIADFAREVAYIYNRQPLWSLVAGHCLKAYENGDIQAPMLDPSWPRSFPSLGVDPSKLIYACERCTTNYTPIRYKQRFCSQECGAAAQAEAFAAAAASAASR